MSIKATLGKTAATTVAGMVANSVLKGAQNGSSVNPADFLGGISNMVNNRKGGPKEKATEAALARLAAISSSLEEEDAHQMNADIMLLIREGGRLNDEQKAEWLSALYGRRRRPAAE